MPAGKRKWKVVLSILAVIGLLLFLPVRCGPGIQSNVLESAPVRSRLVPSPDLEYAPDDPYRFQSSDTLVVIPAPRYEAGPLWKTLFGTGYRNLWTSPVAVPVIDLERTAGGLTVLEQGGGTQTKSLQLRGGDGHEYVLRSVDKDISPWIPRIFRRTIGAFVLQDVMSALNPYAALAVPTLATAGGILHASPTLVLIPDSPVLGPYRRSFAGMLTLFERKADENQSKSARFGNSENIVGTEKLAEELSEDAGDFVDQRAYARARLFDMWIGDWDRGAPQWRWAEYQDSTGTRYVAIPRDRDYAFSDFNGLVHKLFRQTGIVFFRRFGPFNDRMNDLVALNHQALVLDRRFTSNLSRDDWMEIADSLESALTDNVIDQAIRAWPPEVVEEAGPGTRRILIARRSRLTETASTYFEILKKP